MISFLSTKYYFMKKIQGLLYGMLVWPPNAATAGHVIMQQQQQQNVVAVPYGSSSQQQQQQPSPQQQQQFPTIVKGEDL